MGELHVKLKEKREDMENTYSVILVFKNGLKKIEKNGQYGLLDQKGKEITPCVYDGILNFKNGFARVWKKDKQGYINEEGKEIAPCIYDFADNFAHGFALVSKDGVYGYVDETGKEYFAEDEIKLAERFIKQCEEDEREI